MSQHLCNVDIFRLEYWERAVFDSFDILGLCAAYKTQIYVNSTKRAVVM